MSLSIYQTSRATIEYAFHQRPDVPTIVFVHGLGGNLQQFAEQVTFFSPHFQVLTLNVWGHGNSAPSGRFSLTRCAQDLIDLLDQLGITQFHFVGNSMGGNIGYELLALTRKRLLSLTTFGTTAVLQTPAVTTNILLFIYRLLPSRFIARLASLAGQTSTSKETIKEMMEQIDKESLLQIVPTIAQFNYLAAIRESYVPILIIKGGKDSDINKVLTSTMQTLEARGNFTEMHMAHVGHFANLDDPDQFNQVLFDFLSRLDVSDAD